MAVQYIDGPRRTFPAAGAIAQYARVKLGSDGTIDVAGATDKDIGIIEDAALAAGQYCAVRLRNAPGTRICIAASAIAVGAEVHTAASGKINDTQATGAFKYGTAITAAAADGDWIEVLPTAHGDTAGS